MLIDDDWIDIFEEFQIEAGVSIDGPKAVHDAMRVDHKGRGSYDDVVKGMQLLQEAAAKGRIPEPGVLSVVQPTASAKETVSHFVDDLSVKLFNILLPDMSYEEELASQDKRLIGKYLIELADEWFARKDVEIDVRILNEFLGVMLRKQLDSLSLSRRNDFSTVITVSSNGDIGPDDTIKSIAPRFREPELNISDSTLGDVMGLPIFRELKTASQQLCTKCMECPWVGICQGGQLPHRFSNDQGFDNPSLFCDELGEFYQHLMLKTAKAGVPVDRLRDRLGELTELTQGFVTTFDHKHSRIGMNP